MIPLKIQLKNFLSYGPILQTIDFGPFPLICLSGKNGHGKSALLDAITWAIWGQARKISGVAKADNLLLRLGQTQMLVIFDFLFNGQQYRIRREYTKMAGKPHASLDFGMINTTTQQFIPLTEKTIRHTQAIIEKTLGLDFEAFINSAFLRQGQANEFSKKTPKERKEILSAILGLNHYEIMRKIAVEKVKEAQLTLLQLHNYKKTLETDLQKIPETQDKIAEVNKKISVLSLEETTLKQQKNELEQRKKNFLLEKQQEQAVQFQYQQKKEEQEKLQLRLIELYTTWKKVHAQQKNIPCQTLLEQQKQELIKQLNKHQQQLQQTLELKTQILEYQQQEQQIRTTINEEIQKELQKQHTSVIILETKMSNKHMENTALTKHYELTNHELLNIAKKINDIIAEKSTLSEGTKEFLLLEQKFEKGKTMYHRWIAQANVVAQELSNLQQKKVLQADETNTSCPLCEQNLSASRKKFLKTKLLQEERTLKHRLDRLSHCTKKLKTMLMDQHVHVETRKNKTLNLTLLEHTYKELANNKQKIELEQKNRQKELLTIDHEIRFLENEIQQHNQLIQQIHQTKELTLLANEKYKTLQEATQEKQKIFQTIQYDQVRHQEVLKSLQLIEQKSSESMLFMQELTKQQLRQAEIHSLCDTLRKVKNDLKTVSKLILNFTHLSSLQTSLQTQEDLLIHNVQTLQKDKETTVFEKGRLENECANLLILEKKYKQQNTEILTLNSIIEEYQILATTFGKDGIQALLIEEALPEIEQEANALLNQLTNNQSHIFIESLRDLQKGGTKETLDIKISDAQGLRPYELFSGGEAFRIDFALRIAISKLLARRAGTSLQTLIIDEGFGSQDEEGLAHIMDALYKIQDNFCKIIIVSHLPALKDQFPVHFFIEKGAQGSTIKVIEQG